MSNSTFIVDGKQLVNADGNVIYGSLLVLENCCCECTLYKLIRQRQVVAGYPPIGLIDITGETEYTLAALKVVVNAMAPYFLSEVYAGGSGLPVVYASNYADGATTEDELYNLVIGLGNQTIINRNTQPMNESWHSAVVESDYATARYQAALHLYDLPFDPILGYGDIVAFEAITWQRAINGFRADIWVALGYFNPDIDFTEAPFGSLAIYARSEAPSAEYVFDKQGYTVPDEGIYGLFATQPTSSGWTTGVNIDLRAAMVAAWPLAVPPNWSSEPPGDSGIKCGFKLSDWFAVGTWNFTCTDPI